MNSFGNSSDGDSLQSRLENRLHSPSSCPSRYMGEACALRCENCGGSLGSPSLPQECRIISFFGKVLSAWARGRVVSNFFVYEIRMQVKLEKCAYFSWYECNFNCILWLFEWQDVSLKRHNIWGFSIWAKISEFSVLIKVIPTGTIKKCCCFPIEIKM